MSWPSECESDDEALEQHLARVRADAAGAVQKGRKSGSLQKGHKSSIAAVARALSPVEHL